MSNLQNIQLKDLVGNDISEIRNKLIKQSFLYKDATLFYNSIVKALSAPQVEKLFELAMKKDEAKTFLSSINTAINQNRYDISPLYASMIEELHSGRLEIDKQISDRLSSIVKLRTTIDDDFSEDLSLIIEQQDSPDFEFLFIVTLRQTYSQEIDDFLTYQSKLYKGNFSKFLRISLLSYSNYIPEKTSLIVKRWISAKKESESTITLDSYWTGTQKTNLDFIVLVYALHKAKYLNNSTGTKTKMVEELAKALNVKLPINWNSNLTKQKHNTGEIFDKLKNAHLEYIDIE